MNGEAPRTTDAGLAGRLLFLIALLLAVWIGKLSFSVNLAQACHARQWPMQTPCAGADDAASAGPAGGAWDRLRQRVADNPGDGLAMADMARYAGLPASAIGIDGASLLKHLAQATPQATEVLQQQAMQALAQRDWATAVPRLIDLAARHADAEAARALARLAVLSGGEPGLLQALRSASRQGPLDWVDRVVRAMRSENLPVSPALPWLGELVAGGVVKPATALMLVGALKSEGQWLDAHAVWLQAWRQPLDLIHNGDFEREFVPRAFDWTFTDGNPATQGALMDRIGFRERGQVLRLRLTGKPLRSPLLTHDLFLPAGRYRLHSDVQATGVWGGGLRWELVCVQGGRTLARSSPLTQAERSWTTLTSDLEVPDGCQASTLALVAGSSAEARAGATGELLLDRVRLTRLDDSQAGGVR
jgi:hypothetical protein